MLSLNGADELADTPLVDTRTETPVGGLVNSEQPLDPRRLVRDLNAFREPQLTRSLWELGVTLVPFLALCAMTLESLDAGYLAALLLTVPAGLFLLRLFLIQHDCGHGSFFPDRAANDWLGRVLGILTLTPYDCWRRSHALHHASTGNLDARGFGDVDTLTVREFEARSRVGQLLYRIYRHPVVLFGIGPAYLFFLRHRLPVGLMREGRTYWFSALGTNAATAALCIAAGYQFGWVPVALVFGLVVLIAGSIGVWLFYIQHQFEDAHWEDGSSWSFHHAALHGSTHLELPPLLRWFTANIGVHHVHHLVSRIPFYRLPEVLRSHPQLVSINRLTPRQTLSTLRLALWDEERRQMVRFPRRQRAPMPAARSLSR